MTKAEIVKQIAGQMGLESKMVAGVVEALLERIRAAQIGGQNVYFRGFGSFVRRERAAKKARDISRNTTVLVPASIGNAPSRMPYVPRPASRAYGPQPASRQKV